MSSLGSVSASRSVRFRRFYCTASARPSFVPFSARSQVYNHQRQQHHSASVCEYSYAVRFRNAVGRSSRIATKIALILGFPNNIAGWWDLNMLLAENPFTTHLSEHSLSPLCEISESNKFP